jgi:hypothetical protein
VFSVPVHDVNYSWGVALNLVFVGAERVHNQKIFPSVQASSDFHGTFLKFKDSSKKMYMNRKVF